MSLELFVFDSRPEVVRAVAGPDAHHRADALVVDWERSDKLERQRHAVELMGFDTQIEPSGPDRLGSIVAASTVPVICRIDAWSGHGPVDLERAIQGGASEVIVPMVSSRGEVEQALATAAGRVDVGIMIETIAACDIADELATLPISRAYLGLMDLALERGTPDIFVALHDGTLDRVAEACSGVPFGFAGLTLPGSGSPVPTLELAAEMLRVRASFTFLRRSFLADARDDLSSGLGDIRQMVTELDQASTTRRSTW
jgi:hypothetical protein